MSDARNYNYERIKEWAKDNGGTITDYLALAPQNDPFYVGTPADFHMAEWFARVWRDGGFGAGTHCRRVHYWVVSQAQPVLMTNGKPYENTEKCWQYLILCSKKARYMGFVSIDDIADNKNPKPTIYAAYENKPVDFTIHNPIIQNPHIWLDGFNPFDKQPYHLEVWCEKSTMNDVLLPICQRFGANLVTFEGEVSITACNDYVKRVMVAGNKPARVFYISDFDPAGNSMPVAMSRKVEYIVSQQGEDCDIMIRPLALTAAQIKFHKLPRIPIKETEKRAAKFESNFGAGAVELDALEALRPGVLGGFLEVALRTYWDASTAREVANERARMEVDLRKKIAEVSSRYTEQIAAVQNMLDEIQNIEVEGYEYDVERAYAEASEDRQEWLFDSGRDYLNQIEYYRAHKQGD